MASKYISRDQDISRLINIFREETKDGVDREFIICPERYRKQNPTAITYYAHPESIDNMSQDGFLKIINSYPFLDASISGMVGPNVYKIFVHADKLKRSIEAQQMSNKPKQLENKKPPENWQLLPQKDNKVHFIKNKELLFVFPNNWAQKYKYFECLWNYYDQYVPYKIIYESGSTSKYPKDTIAKVNSDIRNVFTKLKSEMKKLPVEINITKGAKLTLID